MINNRFLCPLWGTATNTRKVRVKKCKYTRKVRVKKCMHMMNVRVKKCCKHLEVRVKKCIFATDRAV